MKKIVIIEDDIAICKMIKKFLENNGYMVSFAVNGIEGVDLVKEKAPDLILLDLMLPEMNGNKVLPQIRKFTNTPIVVVSAKTMVQSKIDLLKLGADDYITKPFDLYELLARIEVILKRYHHEEIANTVLKYKEIEIKDSRVFINENEIGLTATEWKILQLLMKYPAKVFSKQNLYESVWHDEYAYDNDTINSHISNIRKKIKAQTDTEYIETIWGIGYKMK